MRQLSAEPERRTAPRYFLELPTILEWQDEQGPHVCGGFTRDVSLKSLRVMCAGAPPISTSVSVRVVLPAPNRSNRDVQIRGAGEIARVLGDHEGLGVAISAVLDLPDMGESEEDFSLAAPE
jgi:hypothetical protein